MEYVASDDYETTEATEYGLEGVHLAEILTAAGTTLQYFRLDPGASVPAHSHPDGQAGYVVGGVYTIKVKGESFRIGPGEAYALSGGEVHATVNNGSESIEGIDVFHPPRETNWHDDAHSQQSDSTDGRNGPAGQ